MRLKLFIGIALAIAVVVGARLWLHRNPPAAQSVVQVTPPVVAALPRPVPLNAARMTTVGSKPAGIRPPATTDWPAVQMIMDTQASYEQRMKAVNSLSSHLTAADWEALRKFLLAPDTLDRTQTGQVIKNRLLDVLCALDPPPADLGDMLAQIYHDRRQNEVLRDYAVQHLTAFYEQVARQPDGAQTMQAAQDVLWEAVKETDVTIGGTALLALKRLSQEFEGLDQNRIAATALQMAGDKNAGEMTHITAYQVCAQLGTAEALPLVREAAQNGETISVRMSAIGALGQLGGPEDISFLNSVLTGTEDRLKLPAQWALNQIQQR